MYWFGMPAIASIIFCLIQPSDFYLLEVQKSLSHEKYFGSSASSNQIRQV